MRRAALIFVFIYLVTMFMMLLVLSAIAGGEWYPGRAQVLEKIRMYTHRNDLSPAEQQELADLQGYDTAWQTVGSSWRDFQAEEELCFGDDVVFYDAHAMPFSMWQDMPHDQRRLFGYRQSPDFEDGGGMAYKAELQFREGSDRL